MEKSITPSESNELPSDQSELLSSAIDLLRFPLALMVIFIHTTPQVVNLIDADFSLFSGRGIYNVTGIIGSHVLAYIAVPTFYLISGFLFFYNFDQWSWSTYRRKIRSRIKTLFIPYILWNLLPFLLLLLFMLGGVLIKDNPADGIIQQIEEKNWHIFYDYYEWDTTTINWLGEHLRMTGPYDLPLWFIRDLIVVTLLTPVIYYAIKKFKICLVLFLFIAYVSKIWILTPGFHITAFFYFSVGAYMALNGINIVSFARKYKFLFIPVCVILFIITTIYDGCNTVIGQNLHPFFICSGVFTAFIISSWCIEKWNVKPNRFLVSSCFFIYALHTIDIPLLGSPLGGTNRVLHLLIPGTSAIEDTICYILSPFITAFLCIAVLMLSRKLLPNLTLLFSGNK